jgi:hypothetical protein
MSRACTICKSSLKEEIDARLRLNQRVLDIIDFAASRGARISTHALYRHRAHVARELDLETKTIVKQHEVWKIDEDTDIYKQVIKLVSSALDSGLLRPSVRDAIIAQKYLDERAKARIEVEVASRVARMLVASAQRHIEKETEVKE